MAGNFPEAVHFRANKWKARNPLCADVLTLPVPSWIYSVFGAISGACSLPLADRADGIDVGIYRQPYWYPM